MFGMLCAPLFSAVDAGLKREYCL